MKLRDLIAVGIILVIAYVLYQQWLERKRRMSRGVVAVPAAIYSSPVTNMQPWAVGSR